MIQDLSKLRKIFFKRQNHFDDEDQIIRCSEKMYRTKYSKGLREQILKEPRNLKKIKAETKKEQRKVIQEKKTQSLGEVPKEEI